MYKIAAKGESQTEKTSSSESFTIRGSWEGILGAPTNNKERRPRIVS
jgi:hypothetical protein